VTSVIGCPRATVADTPFPTGARAWSSYLLSLRGIRGAGKGK
jgi:hypothetical protein